MLDRMHRWFQKKVGIAGPGKVFCELKGEHHYEEADNGACCQCTVCWKKQSHNLDFRKATLAGICLHCGHDAFMRLASRLDRVTFAVQQIPSSIENSMDNFMVAAEDGISRWADKVTTLLTRLRF